MKSYFLVLIAACLVVTGCVTPTKRAPKVDSISAEIEAKKQRQLVIENQVEMSRRLVRITYPLVLENADLCGENTRHIVGASYWNTNAFKEEWRETVQSLYGLTDLLQVSNVIEGSPADIAGLHQGDVLVSVNDRTPSSGENAAEQFSETLNELTQSGDDITFKVNRRGKEITIPVAPVKVCDFTVNIKEDDTINAYADGKQMIFTTGMMDFARTDQELALVVAHELAHNSEEHIKAQTTNAMIGGLFGLIIDVAAAYGGVNTQGTFTDIGMRAGAGAYSVDFERNADYVGLYYMSRAGYEIDGAANFWRRMSLRNEKSISMTTTHPSNAERFVGIEKSIEEIQSKQLAGIVLIPESIEKEEITEAIVSTEGVDVIEESASDNEETMSVAQEDIEVEEKTQSDPVTSFFKKLFKRSDKQGESNESSEEQ